MNCCTSTIPISSAKYQLATSAVVLSISKEKFQKVTFIIVLQIEIQSPSLKKKEKKKISEAPFLNTWPVI